VGGWRGGVDEEGELVIIGLDLQGLNMYRKIEYLYTLAE
jgi:hypothetical protein